jgi:hypothetical protein
MVQEVRKTPKLIRQGFHIFKCSSDCNSEGVGIFIDSIKFSIIGQEHYKNQLIILTVMDNSTFITWKLVSFYINPREKDDNSTVFEEIKTIA